MTQTTDLNAMLKSTAIAPHVDFTDKLLAIGSDGVLKGTHSGVMDYTTKKIGTPGWLRVAKWEPKQASYCIISIFAQYNHLPGAVAWIAFKASNVVNRCGVKTIARFEDSTASQQVKKARVAVSENGDCYLDVYYPYNTENDITIMTHLSGVSTLHILRDFETDAQIPEGYSVKEFDLTE